MILTGSFCIKKFANNLALTGDKGDGLLGVTRFDYMYSLDRSEKEYQLSFVC